MDHGTDHQMLGVSRHGKPGKEDDDSRNNVPLRTAVPGPTHPHAEQASAPPNNTHSGMLEVVMAPFLSPAMFRERVDAPPRSDDERIEELLTAACAAEPELPHQKKKREHDAVRDERTSHDKVRQTLP